MSHYTMAKPEVNCTSFPVVSLLNKVGNIHRYFVVVLSKTRYAPVWLSIISYPTSARGIIVER